MQFLAVVHHENLTVHPFLKTIRRYQKTNITINDYFCELVILYKIVTLFNK